MATVLAQLFVALGVSLVVGFALGFTFGVSRDRRDDQAQTPIPLPTGDNELDEIVQREASLIEQLARADDDLRAHAVEIADANEEITCLLEQLHEARRPN